MSSLFLKEAKAEGIENFEVSLLVYKVDGFLLLEKFLGYHNGFYEPLQGPVKEGESLNQALDRIAIEQASLKLERLDRFLCFFDRVEGSKKIRRFYFIAKALDPEDLVLSGHHSFAWLQAEEAIGYPISDELRQAFDFYIKNIENQRQKF